MKGNYSIPCAGKETFETLCVIWCHLHNLKNMENTHEGVIFLVKLQSEACMGAFHVF